MSDLPQNHRIEETPSGYRTIRPPRLCLEASLRLLADLAFRLLVRLAATQVGCVHLACDTREIRKRKQGGCDGFQVILRYSLLLAYHCSTTRDMGLQRNPIRPARADVILVARRIRHRRALVLRSEPRARTWLVAKGLHAPTQAPTWFVPLTRTKTLLMRSHTKFTRCDTEQGWARTFSVPISCLARPPFEPLGAR